jgi:hypothetical protein
MRGFWFIRHPTRRNVCCRFCLTFFTGAALCNLHFRRTVAINRYMTTCLISRCPHTHPNPITPCPIVQSVNAGGLSIMTEQIDLQYVVPPHQCTSAAPCVIATMRQSCVRQVAVKYEPCGSHLSVMCHSCVSKVSVICQSSVSKVSVMCLSCVSQVSVMAGYAGRPFRYACGAPFDVGPRGFRDRRVDQLEW